ncbi:nucleoid DNA-binding protein [Entomoplasma freundtii]|uniref:HU family DNA-binding protein n=1 Tax=Entomoplasma freundtii TaxID=74700 RepID=UPI000C28EB09|nr:HU family DNA-binding protein [Entomoplasma freundtii]TDY56818.1 nucleoid DNA-binding protein [Entomoplasma freundtii]
MKWDTLSTKKTLAEDLMMEKDFLTAKDAKEIVDIIFDSIANDLIEKHVVEIHGFGKFKTEHVKKRVGVNPATGEKIIISARTKPKFIASKTLKDAIDPNNWSKVETKVSKKHKKALSYVNRMTKKYAHQLSKQVPKEIMSVTFVELEMPERANVDGSLEIKEARSDLIKHANETRDLFFHGRPELEEVILADLTKRELLEFMREAVKANPKDARL